ncbi:hypothetical protein [Empedobacter tilapiae]
MVKIIYTLIISALLFGCSNNSYENIKKNSSKELIDSKKYKYLLLDETNQTIYCFDNHNKFVWKTIISPEFYRFKNPKIEVFEVGKSNRVNNKEIIFIKLENSIFGYLDLKNGYFTELGRD